MAFQNLIVVAAFMLECQVFGQSIGVVECDNQGVFPQIFTTPAAACAAAGPALSAGQFVIPVTIKPILQPEPFAPQFTAPVVPNFGNFAPSFPCPMAPIIIDDGGGNDDNMLLYFLLIALNSRNGGGGSGGCGGCGGNGGYCGSGGCNGCGGGSGCGGNCCCGGCGGNCCCGGSGGNCCCGGSGGNCCCGGSGGNCCCGGCGENCCCCGCCNGCCCGNGMYDGGYGGGLGGGYGGGLGGGYGLGLGGGFGGGSLNSCIPYPLAIPFNSGISYGDGSTGTGVAPDCSYTTGYNSQSPNDITIYIKTDPGSTCPCSK